MEDEVVVESPAGAEAPPAAPSLRDTLTQALEKNPIFTEDAPRDTSLDRAETPQQRQTRERDQAGRFARVNKDGSEVPTEQQVAKAKPNLSLDPDEPLDDVSEGGETDIDKDPIPSVDNAPKSWKAAAKERWATADPVIRAEVHRRERDMARAVQEHAPVKKFTESFQATIQPYADHYGPQKIAPLQLFNNLMQADVTLSRAPAPVRAQFMAKLIKDYGIDINMLDAALSGGDPGSEPSAQLDRLLDQRLAPLTSFVQSETQRREQVVQRERDRAATVLQRMEADAVNFPHFKTVAADMADVTEMAAKRGIYLTPQDAYTRAVALNPEAQAAEQGRAGQQRAREAHDAATRSLGASLSVSGSPAHLTQKVDPSDLRGTIQAAWDAAQGR